MRYHIQTYDSNGNLSEDKSMIFPTSKEAKTFCQYYADATQLQITLDAEGQVHKYQPRNHKKIRLAVVIVEDKDTQLVHKPVYFAVLLPICKTNIPFLLYPKYELFYSSEYLYACTRDYSSENDLVQALQKDFLVHAISKDTTSTAIQSINRLKQEYQLY